MSATKESFCGGYAIAINIAVLFIALCLLLLWYRQTSKSSYTFNDFLPG